MLRVCHLCRVSRGPWRTTAAHRTPDESDTRKTTAQPCRALSRSRVRTQSGTARVVGARSHGSCVVALSYHFPLRKESGGGEARPGQPGEVIQPRCGFRATSGLLLSAGQRADSPIGRRPISAAGLLSYSARPHLPSPAIAARFLQIRPPVCSCCC